MFPSQSSLAIRHRMKQDVEHRLLRLLFPLCTTAMPGKTIVPLFATLFGLLGANALLADTVAIAKPHVKTAFNDPAEAGIDFAFQGEYGGFYGTWGYGPEVGLQVIARGEGQFDAVLYNGGLPGAAWDGEPPVELSGALEGETLTLKGEQLQIVLTLGKGAIYNKAGRQIARLVKLQRVSRTLGARPPYGATVLFDGKNVNQFASGARMENGLLTEGALTKEPVGDFYLHLEFRLPLMPYARGQARANSGVYIQQRYEVQILDSFGAVGKADECGAIYRQTPPKVNMCLPPLTWQTYDIFFYAPRWNDQGEKIRNARITVLHNGVAVHKQHEIENKTGAGKPESPELLPILLQNHGDPVRFRNIWMTAVAPDTPSPSPSNHRPVWYQPRPFPLSTWCR